MATPLSQMLNHWVVRLGSGSRMRCATCGKELELRVHDVPGGPLVSSICQACATIRVPVRGPEADEAIEAWRRERSRRPPPA